MANFKKVIMLLLFLTSYNVQAQSETELVKYLHSYRTQLQTGISASNKNVPYTMVHQFYLPLIHAQENSILKSEFDKLFTIKFLADIRDTKILSDLDKIIFYFFTAEYLRFHKDSANYDEILTTVTSEVIKHWRERPGKVWKSESLVTKGKRDRINNILNKKYNGNKSYYNAITDSELFLMAAGTSLSVSNPGNKQLFEIRDYLYKVFQSLVSFTDNREWVLQPNVWKDHADYRAVKGERDVDWDASHFSRMPAFLDILSNSNLNSQQVAYVRKLQEGLVTRFLSKVVIYDSSVRQYRFNNYMNGKNAGYRTQHKTKVGGFRESENYTHIFYGWWKLLNDSRVDQLYENLSKNFGFYSNENKSIRTKKGLYSQLLKY